MTNARHAVAAVAGLLVLVLAACGAPGAATAVAPAAATAVAPAAATGAAPDISALSAADQALVRFEAQWLCDVQRHAYSDLADVEAARSQLMTGFGVAPATYDDFKLRLESESELRGHVSETYVFSCGS